MLLNLHCNDNMNFNDGSCCKTSDVPSGLQKFTFYLFLSCGVLFIIRRLVLIFFQTKFKVPEEELDDYEDKSWWSKINIYKGEFIFMNNNLKNVIFLRKKVAVYLLLDYTPKNLKNF